MTLEFVRAVVVDGTAFKAGDIVEVGAQSPDYFASCLRMGHAVKVEQEPKASEPKAKSK